MEEVLVRFHQIGKRIFEELDNKCLTKCREVNESWRGFIDDEKTVPFRIINSLTNVHKSYLDKNFGKTDLDSVRELVKNVQLVCSDFNKLKRNFEIKASIFKSYRSNPEVFFMTALRIAAKKGYLNVCKLIFENVYENNPKFWGEKWVIETLLQTAKEDGHPYVVEYFQSLLDNVEQPRKKQRKLIQKEVEEKTKSSFCCKSFFSDFLEKLK